LCSTASVNSWLFETQLHEYLIGGTAASFETLPVVPAIASRRFRFSHKVGEPSSGTDNTNPEEVILGIKSATEFGIGRLHLINVPPRANKPAMQKPSLLSRTPDGEMAWEFLWCRASAT
jgi:hypothetical protein